MNSCRARTSIFVAALDKAGAEKLLAGADKDTLLVLYAPWCPFCQGMEGAYAELAARLAGSHVRVAKLNADGALSNPRLHPALRKALEAK